MVNSIILTLQILPRDIEKGILFTYIKPATLLYQNQTNASQEKENYRLFPMNTDEENFKQNNVTN